MAGEPAVVGSRGSVGRPLDESVEGGTFLTGAVALPPVLLVQCNLDEENSFFNVEILKVMKKLLNFKTMSNG